MKKLIFSVTNDLTYDRRMIRICTSLSQAGYQVALVGRKQKHSVKLIQTPFSQKRLHCLFQRGKLFYIEFNIRLFFYLLFRKFDAACAIDLDTILPVLFVSKFKNKKCLYDAHEYFTEVPELLGRNFTKRVWESVARFAIPKMSSCYTVNESLSIRFKERYNKKFRTIRNLPVLTTNRSVEKHDRMIIYQGAVNAGRGLEELIEAIKDIDVHLVIAGYGDIQHKLKKLIDSKGLQYKVMLSGYLKPDQLVELTPKAFLGYNLLDYRSLSYYYSLSNKFFDYIHAGIPSLSNPFPEYKIINEKYKVSHLTDLNSDEIKKAIVYLLDNEDYYNELKRNCLKAREIFNWQIEQQNLFDIYNELF